MSTKLIMLEALYYEKSSREISGKIEIITNVFLHQRVVIKKFTMRYKKVIALLQKLTRAILLIFRLNKYVGKLGRKNLTVFQT